MEIKQSLLETWFSFRFIIRGICFYYSIRAHFPTGHNLQTIPDPLDDAQMDRSHWSFMLVVFFTFCFPSMDSTEIWLFLVSSLVSQLFL